MHIDQRWRAWTTNKESRMKYRIQSKENVDFIKNPNVKAYYKKFWKWISMFTLHKNIALLPPSVWNFFPCKNTITQLKEFSLREHQSNALDFVQQQIADNKRSCFVESVTWSGKTYLLLWVCSLWWNSIIVVPNRWIWHQLVDTISNYYTCWWYWTWSYDVTIICYASFNKVYEDINWSFDFLLLDELHNIPQARRDQIIKWKWSFIFWCTATPIRKEFDIDWFKLLLWNVFNTWVKTIPVNVFLAKNEIKVSLSDYIKLTTWLAPESPEALRRVVVNNDDRNQKIFALIKRLWKLWMKKLIFFSDRTQHLENLSSIIWDDAILFYGKSDIDDVKQRIKSKDCYVILWNIKCCWEWFDVPELQCWILWVSTTWVKSIVQMAWRMVRIFPWKTEAFFVDIMDTLQVDTSKKKYLWTSQRKKMYQELWWNIRDLKEMPSFLLSLENKHDSNSITEIAS